MYEHFSRRPKEIEDAIIANWGPSKVHKNVFSKDETKRLIQLFKIAPNAKLRQIVQVKMEKVSEFKSPFFSQDDISINENSEYVANEMTIKKAVYALSLNTKSRPNKTVDFIKIKLISKIAL